MLAELVEFKSVGSILGVTVGSIVTILATSTLHSHKWTIALWHYWAPLGVIAAPIA